MNDDFDQTVNEMCTNIKQTMAARRKSMFAGIDSLDKLERRLSERIEDREDFDLFDWYVSMEAVWLLNKMT